MFNNSNNVYKITTAGLLIAMGIILPAVFHVIEIGGRVFLPMHIPVLLAGAILGPYYGTFIGILLPVLNNAITSMPPISIMPVMMVELGSYGLISGCLFKIKKLEWYFSLPITLIAGRIITGTALWLLLSLFGWAMLADNPWSFILAGTIAGLPGIIIQVVFIPLLLNVVNSKVLEGDTSSEL